MGVKPHIRRILDVLGGVTLLLSASLVIAESNFHPLKDIQKQIKTFVETQTSYAELVLNARVGNLDPRLKLRRCAHPLEVDYTNPKRKAGQVSVAVNCPGPVSWRIYVGVNVEIYGDVLVVTRSVQRGSRINPQDVQLENRNLAALNRGYYQSVDELEFLRAKQQLRPGTLLNPSNVETRKLVYNGDLVTIVAKTDSLNVRTQGRALNDASAGQRVRIRNDKSGRIIEATVVAEGVVEVR